MHQNPSNEVKDESIDSIEKACEKAGIQILAAPETKTAYYQAIFQLKADLNALSSPNVESALSAFEQCFEQEIKLDVDGANRFAQETLAASLGSAPADMSEERTCLVDTIKKNDTEIVARIQSAFDTLDGPVAKTLAQAFSVATASAIDCAHQHELIYHNPYHAAEMMVDPAYFAKKHGLSKGLQYLLTLCGLMHDAIFTSSRVFDEINSATLLKKLLAPTLETLSAEHASVIARCIDVLIVGGTLPVVSPKQPEDFSQLGMWALYETFLKIYPKYNNTPSLRNILLACECMAEGDVQRSLMPESLAEYPRDKESNLPEMALLRQFVESVIKPRHLKGYSHDELVTMMLVKMSQSGRFSAEARMDIKDPDNLPHFIPRGMMVKAKRNFSIAIKTGRNPGFTVDDIKVFKAMLIGEVKFADMNLASLCNKASVVTRDVRPYRFGVFSWTLHKQVLEKFEASINPANLQDAAEKMMAWCVNANWQQGKYLDPEQLVSRLNHTQVQEIESAGKEQQLEIVDFDEGSSEQSPEKDSVRKSYVPVNTSGHSPAGKKPKPRVDYSGIGDPSPSKRAINFDSLAGAGEGEKPEQKTSPLVSSSRALRYQEGEKGAPVSSAPKETDSAPENLLGDSRVAVKVEDADQFQPVQSAKKGWCATVCSFLSCGGSSGSKYTQSSPAPEE